MPPTHTHHTQRPPGQLRGQAPPQQSHTPNTHSTRTHTTPHPPRQVNYVGKAANLYADAGYKLHGSAYVIEKYLGTSWLWDRVRSRCVSCLVCGGALGSRGAKKAGRAPRAAKAGRARRPTPPPPRPPPRSGARRGRRVRRLLLLRLALGAVHVPQLPGCGALGGRPCVLGGGGGSWGSPWAGGCERPAGRRRPPAAAQFRRALHALPLLPPTHTHAPTASPPPRTCWTRWRRTTRRPASCAAWPSTATR